MSNEKIASYLDRVNSELYYCLEEFHQMDIRSQQDALDIAVKLYYLQTITHEMLEEWMKGGEK